MKKLFCTGRSTGDPIENQRDLIGHAETMDRARGAKGTGLFLIGKDDVGQIWTCDVRIEPFCAVLRAVVVSQTGAIPDSLTCRSIALR